MRLIPLMLALTALAACDGGSTPTQPSADPTPRPCPEGEPDCGPAGI